jgi:hypothetical protein
MNDVIKVEPYVINQANGKSMTIVGIRATMWKTIVLNKPEREATFHFTFLDDKGQQVGEMNASRNTIYPETVEVLKGVGLSQTEAEAEAKNRVNQLIAALGGGSDAESFAAMTIFASSYGYTILPLVEQDGILVYPETTTTTTSTSTTTTTTTVAP